MSAINMNFFQESGKNNKHYIYFRIINSFLVLLAIRDRLTKLTYLHTINNKKL